MTSIEQRFAIDISNWQTKRVETIIQDTASFVLEAGNRSLEKRINPGVVSLTEFAFLLKKDSLDPEDIATVQIYRWANKNSPAIKIWTKSPSPTTSGIFEEILPFTDLNPGSVMIWLSSPLEGTYKESRIVVYQAVEINGQKYLFFRAICGTQNTDECLNIARQLSFFQDSDKNFDQITGPEHLRATPFSITIPPNETFTGFLRRFIDLPKVWETISKGEDLKEKKQALEEAGEIVQKNYQTITTALSFDQQWEIGRRLEESLQEKMGFGLKAGACGVLYSSLLYNSPLTELLQRGSLVYSSKIGGEKSKFIHNCGACGKSLKRYMSKGDRCPYCGGTYEGC